MILMLGVEELTTGLVVAMVSVKMVMKLTSTMMQTAMTRTSLSQKM